MSKLNSLLDGTTILNFPFYLRLFKRYLKSVVFISLFIICSLAASYFLQQKSYWTAIGFSDSSTTSSDPQVKMLSAFLGDDKKNGKSAEILNYRTSMDFNRKLIVNLEKNPQFMSLHLDRGFFYNPNNSVKAIVNKCKKNHACITKKLIEKLPKFYDVIDRDRSGTNFQLQVDATDVLTATVLLNEIKKTIEEARIESVKASIQQQETANLGMVEQKKKELEAIDYYKLAEDRLKNENDLRTNDANFTQHSKLLTEIQFNLATAESKMKRGKKISRKQIDRDLIENERKSADLKLKIEKLTSDINTLENMNTDITEKDKKIIAELKKELKENKKELRKIDSGSSSSALDKFVKTTEDKVNSSELDYHVLKDQQAAAKEKLQALEAEKKVLIEKKADIDKQLDLLKPSIEFLKTAEAKAEMLRLLRTTSVSDMKFDVYATPPEGTRKIGKLLIVSYGIALIFVLNFIYLSIRFLLDDRIYDEGDLEIISDRLKVVGIGPEYDIRNKA